MMNTGAVSQAPVAAGEVGDRSRGAAGKGGDENDGAGFPGLLSKLANSRPHADRQAVSARQSRNGDSDRGKVADWLLGGSEISTGSAADADQADAPQDGDAAGLTSIDVTALLHVLAGNGVVAGAGGLAAMAERVANGTATEAESTIVQAALTAQHDDPTLSPEEIIRASLATANKMGEKGGEGGNPATTINAITITGRETHFAPVRAAGGTPEAVAAQWALAQTAGDSATRAALRPDADVSADGNLVPPGDVAENGARAQLTALHAAVTAASGAQSDTDWRQGASSRRDMQQPDPDAPFGGDSAIEQAQPVLRSDALVNAGTPAGGAIVQQIADRVAGDATSLAAQTGRADTPAFVVKHDSPVRVLNIQLQPADLGTVTIRMSVKDQTLRLDLEVGRGDTAHLIQRDRETLSALLRSAGYVIDGLQVRVADQAGINAQSSNGQAGMQMQGGGQSGSSQTDGRTPGERPRDGHQSNSFGHGRNGKDDQAGHTRHGSGIYL